MTIGELARRTGMTVRNIRAHQTRGILPPPEVHGRTGYYGEEHVARIELTREMQADGLNLEAIRRVLGGADPASREFVGFARALRASFETEAPEIVTASELAASWRVEALDPELVRRAEAAGLLRALPEDRFEVISPQLHRAGAALTELGVSAEAAVATAERLRAQAEEISRTFIDLFVEQIWEPFDRAGRPEAGWPQVREALDRLLPVASEAMHAMFGIVMAEGTEKASERTLRDAAAQGRSAAAGADPDPRLEG
jgi:DNA-binding transcriptional MerR regulator